MELGSARTTNVIAALAFAMVLVGFFADRKLDALWPFTLSYETEGIKCDSDRCELSVWIRNNGWAAQRDVRFELPELGKSYKRIYVSRGYKLLTDTSQTTIDLGVIHPGSNRLVSLYYPIAIDLALFRRDMLTIYSADSEASYAGPGDEAFALPKWWWYSIYTLAGLAVLSLITRIFESTKGRYLRLLREQDSALKAYRKSRASLGKVRRQLAEVPSHIVDTAEAEMEKWPRWFRPKSRRGSARTPKPATERV